MSEIILRMDNVTKWLDRFHLGPLNIELQRGTVVGIIGPNGSGKSTLFRLMTNLLQTDSGTLTLFGHQMIHKETQIKQKIGYVGDHFEYVHHLTINEITEIVSYWYPQWSDEKYNYLIHRYDIDTNVKFGKCSKGTKKKIEFIFSLVHEPELLILDEPTAGVDIVSQRKMKEDLYDYLDDGMKSIIMATHVANEINLFCDYVYVIQDGKLIHSFEKDSVQSQWARLWVSEMPAHILTHPNVIKVYNEPAGLLTNNAEAIEEVLHQEGIAIIQRQNVGLDEALEWMIERNIEIV